MTDSPRRYPAWIKPALELGPVAAFFVAYLLVRDRTFMVGGREYDGFILVTAGFIPLILLSTALLWRITGKLSKMQVMTAVLITVFGGLSVWLNDDRFFKMKPTLIYLLFGGALGLGLLRGQSWLRLVMEEAVPLDDAGWMKLTRRLTFFFLGLALLNEIVWRTQTTDTWVWFKTFGLTAAVFVFFLTQGKLLQEHGISRDKDAPDDGTAGG